MIKSVRIFLLVALLLPVCLVAQTSDAGGIGAIGLTADIAPSLSASLSQEVRFNQNLTNFDRAVTTLGVDYTLIRKLLKVGVDYDFMCYNQINYFEIRHRASLGFEGQQKVNEFNFKLRTKLQSTWRDETLGDYKFNPKYVWRNKLECSYTIFGSPVKPFASAEIFCPLNGANGFYMDGYRFIGGAKYRTSEHTTFEFMLRYDQEIQQANPKRILYGGLGWYYSF